MTLEAQDDVVCCYVRQSKHWVTGPDGQRWENYVVLADAQPELEGKSAADVDPAASTGGCCGTPAADTTAGSTAAAEPSTAAACC